MFFGAVVLSLPH